MTNQRIALASTAALFTISACYWIGWAIGKAWRW